MRINLTIIFLALLGGTLPAQVIPAPAVQAAIDYYTDALNDPDRLPTVMAGLRSTGDPALADLFANLTRAGQRDVRLLATVMIARVAGDDAAPALRDRLKNDPAMVVRSEALLQLLELDAIDNDTLEETLAIDDEGVQMIAARALVRRDRPGPARPVLRRLARSRDPATATLARMTLLKLGDRSQIPHLRRIILDPASDDELLLRLLRQIREEKIADAVEVAKFLASPDQPMVIRLEAFRTIAAMDPRAVSILAGDIKQETNTIVRVNLTRMLGDLDDATAVLRQLAGGEPADPVTTAARFELARRQGGPPVQQAVAAMIRTGHPILIDYVLNSLREELTDNPARADFYCRPLLAYIRRTDLPGDVMTPDHDRVAMAVELLAELDTPTARAGLKKILDGPYSPTKKVTAGALYRCENPAVADLARPLLNSAYPQIRTYGALLLGRAREPRAARALLEIQDTARTRNDEVLSLANWFLIRLANQADPAVKAITRSLQ